VLCSQFSAVCLLALAVVTAGVMIPIQVWNIETDRAEELHNIMLPNRKWSQLESGVREAFKDKWTPENRGKFALYYITDLSEPLLSRANVSNQAELDAYLVWHSDSGRHSFLQLFLNVAIIFQASGKPVSPLKPPLSIDTAIARSQDTFHQPRFSSHLSPDSATSPQSPGTPREKEFRQVVLARDSDGNVRPDEASLAAPVSIFRCVFCKAAKLPNLVKGAHVVPHSERERLGKVLDNPTLLRIGGVESLSNGVSVCNDCHEEFDAGLMWVEQANDATPPTIHVHDSIRSVQLSIGQLHEHTLRRPCDTSFPFPSALAFLWRKEWAVLKRDKSADKTAEKLAKLGLGGDCPGSCGGKPKNKACKNGLCKGCCDKTITGCSVHPLSGRPVPPVAAAAAAAPSPSGGM
jgi:hypothetical protein